MVNQKKASIETASTGGGEGQFRLSGELDFGTISDVYERSHLLFVSYPKIIIDMADIHYSNSAGLALLLEWIKDAQRKNKTIEFKNIPQALLDIARTTGLDGLLSA